MRNLHNSLAFTLPFLGYQPLLADLQEPALTAANIVKQTILGPPFAWRWNRTEVSFTCPNLTVAPAAPAYGQDNILVAYDFGFIEKFILTDTSGDVKEISNQNVLSLTSATARPGAAAIQNDDSNGNLTVRLNNLPDQAYKVTLQYQRKAAPIYSPASTWYPIPDEMSYIYDWGFLAIASLITKDARFPIFTQKFMAHLLGAQDGLSELQRNLFMGNFLDSMKAMERAQVGTQLATTGRSV